MKALLVIITLATAFAGARGQGKVNFSTYNFAPVTNLVTMQLVPTGPDWWAQLYYGPAGAAESQLISMTNAPVHFAVAGYILNSTPRYTDMSILAEGVLGTFQVRVWEAALGGNWETALMNWLDSPVGPLLGKSNLALIVPADAVSDPPMTPAKLSGTSGGQIPVRGFYVVPIPEPGTMGLGLAGAFTLLWHWRRR